MAGPAERKVPIAMRPRKPLESGVDSSASPKKHYSEADEKMYDVPPSMTQKDVFDFSKKKIEEETRKTKSFFQSSRRDNTVADSKSFRYTGYSDDDVPAPRFQLHMLPKTNTDEEATLLNAFDVWLKKKGLTPHIAAAARLQLNGLLRAIESDEVFLIHSIEIPKKAPKLYVNAPRGQNIIDFLRDPEGWGPYTKVGALARPDLRRLDPKAATALDNWLRTHELPSDVRIPKKSEMTDHLISQFENSASRPAFLDRTIRTRARRSP